MARKQTQKQAATNVDALRKRAQELLDELQTERRPGRRQALIEELRQLLDGQRPAAGRAVIGIQE